MANEIIKEYTDKGIKLTHPSGLVTVTTIDALRRQKEREQASIKKSEEHLHSIGQDMLGLLNAGAT